MNALELGLRDEVFLRATIVGREGELRLCELAGVGRLWMRAGQIEAIARRAGEIGVGDRVTIEGVVFLRDEGWVVAAIDGDEAWLKRGGDGDFTRVSTRLPRLRRVEAGGEAPPEPPAAA